MKRFVPGAVAAALLLAGCGVDEVTVAPDLAVAPTAGSVKVVSGADAGPGSFRYAVEAANTDPTISSIIFESGLGTISLTQPVTYTGIQALLINGSGAALDGSALPPGETAFLGDGGGALTFRALTVQNAPGAGITVDLPDDATGTFQVTLADVKATNNGSHGVIINDQAEYFTDPNSTSDSGSAAGLLVTVTGSRFEGNGFTDLDQDGLRVNEGGPGNLVANIAGALVQGNGGDGIELDERSTGDAIFSVINSQLLANGAYSSVDFDDGIDVDEAGDGDILGRFRDVIASNNLEQGIDINENDPGSIQAIMQRVQALGNAEEGIEYEEDDDFAGGGDIIAEITDVVTDGNGVNGGDAGLKLREKGVGNLTVSLRTPTARNNAFGGIQLREDSDGDLFVMVINVLADRNAEDGIDFDENGNGNLTGNLLGTTNLNNNGEAGVDAEQQALGTGTLQYRVLNAIGNGDGAIDADAGVVITQVP